MAEDSKKLSVADVLNNVIRDHYAVRDDVLPEDKIPEVTSKWQCEYKYSFKHVRIMFYAHILLAIMLLIIIARAVMMPSAMNIASIVVVAVVELSVAGRLYGLALYGMPIFELPWVTRTLVVYPDIISDAWKIFKQLREERKMEKKTGMRTRLLGRKRAVFDESEKKMSDEPVVEDSSREKYGINAPGRILELWMRENNLSAADIARESGGELTVKTVIGMIKNDKGFSSKSNIVGLANATNSTIDDWNQAVSDWNEANSE